MGTYRVSQAGRTGTASTAERGRARSLKALYRVGGAAALVAAVLFRRNWGAEFLLLRNLGIIGVGPATAPGCAVEWFALLENHRLIGLTLLDLFDLVNYALVGLILLALCAALRRAREGAIAIAATCGFIGIAVYFASNQAFAILSLSGRYAAATTEMQRSMLLAAGEALLAINQGTGFYLSLLLVTLSDLIVSLVMLGSGAFSRRTATVGLVAHGFQLSFFVALAVAPALLAVPPSVAAPFRLVWYLLIARGLFRLALAAPDETQMGMDADELVFLPLIDGEEGVYRSPPSRASRSEEGGDRESRVIRTSAACEFTTRNG